MNIGRELALCGFRAAAVAILIAEGRAVLEMASS
jgi:hypothetical protein